MNVCGTVSEQRVDHEGTHDRRRRVKITGFHHVSVNCNDTTLAEMVSFYVDLFGLDSKERPEIPGVPGRWFDVSDQELHVVGAPPQGKEIDSTGNHFCLAVEDLEKAIAELEDRKIPYERAVQGAGTDQIWINDPAGNTIELQQDRAPRTHAESIKGS
jgi:catechol 2,3-dioxygenase-like lactoylglutathione lyase family enzyme